MAILTPTSRLADESQLTEELGLGAADLGAGDPPSRAARVPVGVTARAVADQGELVGRLENLSVGGARLLLTHASPPPMGSGLEVSFRLPTGPQLRLGSTVRWAEDDRETGTASCGLQFLPLSGPNRSYLEHYVELAASSAPCEPVRAEIQSKYRLAFDSAGRAQAMLGGMLSREEASAFGAQLKQRLSARKAERLQFAFDVRRLSVCSQDVVVELRRCFELFAHKPEVFGLLIGSKSLALTQLVRASRDAGLADHIFCVNEPEEAARIWAQMEG